MTSITDITSRMYQPIFNPVRHIVEANIARYENYIRVRNIYVLAVAYTFHCDSQIRTILTIFDLKCLLFGSEIKTVLFVMH